MKFFIFFLGLISLNAQDGSLDLTFHSDGRVNTDFGISNDYAYSIFVQSDGKILVGGKSLQGSYYDFALARYNSDGTLDNTFGFGGIITTSVQDNDIISAIKVLSDGKIISVGTTWSGAWIQDFCIVKYNSNGTLDNSFGSSGKVILDIGSINEYATSLEIQSDGKIIIGGYTSVGTNYNFAIVRLNSNGTIDNTFGTGGIVKKSIGTANAEAFSVKLQVDGKILIGGRYNNGSNLDFVILRYYNDGSIDNTFGSSGIVTADFDNRWDTGYSIAIQSDGKILLAGTAEITASNMDFACIRLNIDGTFDNTFGTSGKVNVNVYNINDYCYSVLLQNDNKILMGGATSNSFALVRLNSDGSIDYSFDYDGKVITSFSSSYTEINAMALQTDGKILIAGNGYLWNGFSYTYDFAIARYDNPSLLPVELFYFTALVKDYKVNLNWQTATEVNNYGFEIERTSTSHGIKWQKIGFVAGHGNSNSPKDYSFIDKNPSGGKIKYRLKQIDNDGSFSYSNEVEVNVETPQKFSLEQNYPNPFNPITTIRYSIPAVMVIPTLSGLSKSDNLVTLKVYDILGCEVATLVNERQLAGNYEVKFDGSKFSSGVYFYKLQISNPDKPGQAFVQTKKLILMK